MFLMPPLFNNHGNYIVSLSNVTKWLATQAEELGVEIYPGMAASEPVFDDSGALKGVVAGVFGIAKDGHKKPDYQPGMELHGKYVFIAEGVRGSLAKVLQSKYDLCANSRSAEVWHRHQRTLGSADRSSTSRAWCCTRLAGRSMTRPAAARSCIISAIAKCTSAMSST